MKKNISAEIEKTIESQCLETVGEDGLGIYDLHGLRDVIEHTFYRLYRKGKINYCIHDIEDNCFQSKEKLEQVERDTRREVIKEIDEKIPSQHAIYKTKGAIEEWEKEDWFLKVKDLDRVLNSIRNKEK